MITQVAFVAVPTTHGQRTKHFYSQLLGLATGAEFGGIWSEFHAADGCTIALDMVSPTLPDAPDTPSVYLALETDDIEAEVARLRNEGTPIMRDVWINRDKEGNAVCSMAIVQDPEGHGHHAPPDRSRTR